VFLYKNSSVQKNATARRGKAASLAVLACLAFAPPSWADTEANAPSQKADNKPGKTWSEMTSGMSPAEKTSAERFLGYIWLHGAIAGASSTCDAQMPIIIRECIVKLIARWPTVSGLGDFGEEHHGDIMAAADTAWKTSYNRALQERSSLSQAPSCDSLMGHVKQAPIFDICHPISYPLTPGGEHPAPASLPAVPPEVMPRNALPMEAPSTRTPPTGMPPTGMPPTGMPPTGAPPTGIPPTGVSPDAPAPSVGGAGGAIRIQ
jgi:hypothetical protein